MGALASMGGSLGGLLSAGDVMTQGENYENTAWANNVAQQNASTAMGYSTQMSDTQYQRGVADMQAAGLNPLMMFQSGGGPATSPTGTNAPTAQMPAAPNIGGDVLKGLTSAADLKQTQKTTEATQAQIDKTHSQQANVDMDTVNKGIMTDRLRADQTTAQNQAEASAAQRDAAISEAKYQGAKADLNNKLLYPDAFIDRASKFIPAINSGASTYRLLNTDPTYNPETTGTFDLGTGEIDQ